MKCVHCGRKFDGRRKGACQLDSGKWVCSELCYWEYTYTEEIKALEEELRKSRNTVVKLFRIVQQLSMMLQQEVTNELS